MASKQCIVPDCNRTERTRGLCNSCYLCARKQIFIGETTWERLEGLGLAQRKTPATREGVFSRAFTAAKERDKDA